jgi:hypothetical protein
MANDRNEPAGFETDIKPLFRDIDRQSMLNHFDLWSYDDVSRYAEPILARLRAGDMPCDGPWPEPQIDFFQHWTETGKSR